MPEHLVVSLLGKQFGFLTVIERAGSWTRRGIKKGACWRCVCTCGQQVVVQGRVLRRGKRKACCVNGHRFWTGGRGGLVRKHPSEYSSFKKMHERCKNKKHHRYKRYGARGVTVCARWKTFANFLADMGPKPSRKHSIERKNNDGNYEPGNCVWATSAEQSRNTSRSVFVVYQGERLLLMDLCARFGVNRSIVYGRLKSSWSLEAALFTPVRPTKRKK